MPSASVHHLHLGAPGLPGRGYTHLAEGDHCYLGLFDASAFRLHPPLQRVLLAVVLRRTPEQTRVVVIPSLFSSLGRHVFNLGPHGLPEGHQMFVAPDPRQLPFYLCAAPKGCTRQQAHEHLQAIEAAVATYEPAIDRLAVVATLGRA